MQINSFAQRLHVAFSVVRGSVTPETAMEETTFYTAPMYTTNSPAKCSLMDYTAMLVADRSLLCLEFLLSLLIL